MSRKVGAVALNDGSTVLYRVAVGSVGARILIQQESCAEDGAFIPAVSLGIYGETSLKKLRDAINLALDEE